MPVNDFEKKVQQRMDEFRLRPSASVWPEVEKRIREKKRRRIIFFWFTGITGLVLIGYSGSLYFSKRKNINGTELTQNSAVSRQPVKKQNDQTTTQLSSTDTHSIPAGTNMTNDQVAKTAPGSDNTLIDNKTSKTVSKKITGQNRFAIENSSPSISKSSSVGRKENKEISVSTEATVVNQEKNAVMDKQQEVAVVDEEANKQQLSDLDDGKKEITKKDVTNSESKNDSTITITKAKKRDHTNPWKLGFHFSSGLSSVKNASLPGFENRAADYVSAGSGQVSNGSYRPAPQHFTGPAFSTGVFAEKNFSKRSSVSAGLQYTFITDRISNGLRRDTNTNHFHFIELPLTYQWQMNKGKRTKLFWNVGLMPGVLVHTNGIIYDTAFGGILYKNAAAFDRFHISAITSFYLQPSATHKWQWRIGPEFRFGLTPLQHDPAAERKYYFYTGIDIKFLLPRKK